MLLETATDGGGGGGGAVNGSGNGSAGSGRDRERERGYNDRDRGYERYEREGRYEERRGAGPVYDARELRGGRRAGENVSECKFFLPFFFSTCLRRCSLTTMHAARADSGLAPSVQTYQTHIFAPPVTGAPTKKAKGAGSLASAASASPSASFVGGQQSAAQTANGATAQGAPGEGGRGGVPAAQLVTLGPGGVVVSGGAYRIPLCLCVDCVLRRRVLCLLALQEARRRPHRRQRCPAGGTRRRTLRGSGSAGSAGCPGGTRRASAWRSGGRAPRARGRCATGAARR